MNVAFDQIRPVVITGPTARNGVTLLQRLLNSSGQIIVYGENQYLCEWTPQLVLETYNVHLCGQGDRARGRFLNKTTEFWSSSLWPDTKMYFELMAESFLNFLRLYQKCSEEYGFKRWGIKHPFPSINDFDRFLSLLPRGRFIYIYRNLFGVARSAKARQFVKKPADFERLAVTWRDSLNVVLRIQKEQVLVIKHEDLTVDPNTWIDRLEAFTQVTNIDPSVMSRKFNTFKGPAERGCSPTEYVEPKPLTEEETHILQQTAGELLAALGYTNELPAGQVAVTS